MNERLLHKRTQCVDVSPPSGRKQTQLGDASRVTQLYSTGTCVTPAASAPDALIGRESPYRMIASFPTCVFSPGISTTQ